MGVVITLSNQKGGVGKTTMSIALSVGLSMSGKKVLLIDADPQGHSSNILLPEQVLLELENNNQTFIDYISSRNQTITVQNVKTKYFNLDLIPSSIKSITAIMKGQFPFMNPLVLKTFLDSSKLKNKYDYIVIDSPPEIYTPTTISLVASDYVIIPTTPSLLGLRGVQLTLTEAIPFVQTLNPSLKILGIVFNMHHRRMKYETMQKLLAYIVSKLPQNVFSLLPNDYVYHTSFYANKKYFGEWLYEYDSAEMPLVTLLDKYNELKKLFISFAEETVARIKGEIK